MCLLYLRALVAWFQVAIEQLQGELTASRKEEQAIREEAQRVRDCQMTRLDMTADTCLDRQEMLQAALGAHALITTLHSRGLQCDSDMSAWVAWYNINALISCTLK